MSKAGRLNVNDREGWLVTLDKLYQQTGDEYWNALRDGIRKLTTADMRQICDDRGLHFEAAMRGRVLYIPKHNAAVNAFRMQ